ncbi:MAG: hypothetical protein PW843_03460 [Azospirillaceae bacterium]|nr:hypothetical protein [Azospirillaceae bacterium]
MRRIYGQARRAFVAVFLMVLGFQVPAARAAEAEAEAKSTALEAGCKPNKVEAVQRFVGNSPDLVYKITCQNGKDLAVYVRCQGRTCVLIR